MPIYEFACPKCRKIFSFLSKRLNPERLPVCPKCGNKKMSKQVSPFAMVKGVKEPAAAPDTGEDEGPMPDLDDPRIARAMGELERDMEHLDENNPKHMAHLMRKMKDIMPAGAVPKELDVAIKRLEAGEDPEKIEEDMGDLLGDFMNRAASRKQFPISFGGSPSDRGHGRTVDRNRNKAWKTRLTPARDGRKSPEMNPTQKQFSLNRAASRKQFPISYESFLHSAKDALYMLNPIEFWADCPPDPKDALAAIKQI